jgi:hypothetical protein
MERERKLVDGDEMDGGVGKKRKRDALDVEETPLEKKYRMLISSASEQKVFITDPDIMWLCDVEKKRNRGFSQFENGSQMEFMSSGLEMLQRVMYSRMRVINTLRTGNSRLYWLRTVGGMFGWRINMDIVEEITEKILFWLFLQEVTFFYRSSPLLRREQYTRMLHIVGQDMHVTYI